MKELPALQGPLLLYPGLCNLLDTPQTASGCITGAHVKPQQQKSRPPLSPTALSWLCRLSPGAGRAAVLCSSVSPDVTGLSSSVRRVVKWFCKGTSGFGGSPFLLQVLAVASFHPSALLPPSLPRVPLGGFLGVWPWVHCRLCVEAALCPLLTPLLLQPSHRLLQLSTCRRGSSARPQLSQAALPPGPAPEEGLGTSCSLRPAPQQLRGGVHSAAPPAGAAAFAPGPRPPPAPGSAG
ncbi:uncharacterized protein LOC141949497 [Strix uralensis]|uniref:uncharacterized protein LOC141949497 n=1 Tax=Strix uralensis TaxID=36305 RepID=UPI003DA638FF